MQFTVRKRRTPPAVIIISLIDVLIVVLIFLMVTTTFKQQPSVKLVLPESSQAKKAGANENSLVVTIEKGGLLYFGTQPLTEEKLKDRLIEEVRKNPQATLSINADKDAPFGRVIKVMDAAKAANLKVADASMKSAAPR